MPVAEGGDSAKPAPQISLDRKMSTVSQSRLDTLGGLQAQYDSMAATVSEMEKQIVGNAPEEDLMKIKSELAQVNCDMTGVY